MKATFKIGQAYAGKKSDRYEIRYDKTITDSNFYIWVPMKIGQWVQAARFTLSTKPSAVHITAGWWEIVVVDPILDYQPLLDPKAMHISIMSLFKHGIDGLEKLQ